MAISGFIAGLAGGFYAIVLLVVTPQSVFGMLTSAQALIMALFGGVGIVWGPVIGAVLYVGLQAAVSSQTDLWGGLVGLLLIGLVLSGKGGLWSLLQRGRA